MHQRDFGVRVTRPLLVGFVATFGALGASLALSDPVSLVADSSKVASPGAESSDTLSAHPTADAASEHAGAARRIVSLIPAATEILFAIGAGDRLVGRTHWDVQPPAARSVPSVGDGIRPALELIVAREPDLVILVSGADNAGVAGRLQALRIPVLALTHNTLADLDRNILALGEATDCGASARQLRDRTRQDLNRLAVTTGPFARPGVYYDVWEDPPITIGSGSYLDVLIGAAGGRNIFGDSPDPSPQVSLEAIVARSPDVLLFPVSGSEARERTAPSERPGWSSVRAVAEGRVYRTDGDLAHRLGPRIAEAALEIARVLHPEASELNDLDFRVAAVGVCRP